MKSYFILLMLLAPVISCKKSSALPQSGNDGEWTATTIAGDGTPHFADGPAMLSSFRAPLDVAVSRNGVVYGADALNHRIRKIENGQVTTIAGFGREDTINGTGTAAGFAHPVQIISDVSGNLYTLDIHDFRIRKISPNGVVSTVAGSGIRGYANGRADTARFGECSGITINDQGDIYVTDYDHRRIRKISANGMVTTVAGSGGQGFVDGRGEAAEFFSPSGLVLDKQGNLYVADWNRIRKITVEGEVTSFVGGSASGFQDGPSGTASFTLIADMVIDDKGNIYVSDEEHIRRITAEGVVSTIAGSTAGYLDGAGSVARFNGADGLGIDARGAIYAADSHNNRIRKLSLK